MERYFSIKIRNSLEGKHISGSERIVKESEIQDTINYLYNRAKHKPADSINIKINQIKNPIINIKKTLKIKEYKFDSYSEANRFAIDLLNNITGIDKLRLENLIDLIHKGASSDGSNMRGAMVVDTKGNRLEFDKRKGVRTTEIDFKNREKIEKELIKKGFTKRTADALALTTKNLHHPDIIAEYCISDEPDYLTGYVSTKEFYNRLTPLKEKGNPKGGRIYFVKENTDIKNLYEYLTETPVLIEELDFD